jgi:arylsulfatase A-like enzyme
VVLVLAGGFEGEPDLAGTAPAAGVRPLVDARHTPDLLVERRRLARPPSTAGNRFFTGWSPAFEAGSFRLDPAPAGARLELVHLEPRPRRLVLDLPDGVAMPTGFLHVAAGGRELAAVPLADPLELELPADLPLGRVTLDLAWALPQGAAPPPVASGGVRPVLAAGYVEQRGGDIVQSGDSLLDLVRPVAGGETLVGAFRPPRWPRRADFELLVEREEGEVVGRFAYAPSWLDLLRRPREIRLPVGSDPGFVRVRLRARGGGPSGRWQGLALVAAPPAASEPVAAATAAAPAAPPLAETAAAAPRLAVRAADPLPTAPPPRLVIVYVMDALRADHVGYLGGPRGLTPTLDRLAAEGRAYHRHRSLAPNTLPSTKAFFTGRPVLSAGDARLGPEDGPTLAERFRAAGYRTGLFSGNVFVSRAFGMDRGFEHVAEAELVERPGANRPAGGRGFNDNAARVHAAALAWLRALPPGESAFLYLHVIHPHNPYDPPPAFRRRFAAGASSRIGGSTETLLAVRKGRLGLRPAEVEHLAGLYAAALAYNDAELAGFLRAAGALAPPEETLLALTSDHGEELFEHGGVLHGFTLYEEMLRIPAVLWGPGRVAPESVEDPTDTLDLRRALLGLCGLPAAPEPDAPDPAPEPPVHFAAAASIEGGIYSAQTERWKVIWAPRRGAMWGLGEGIGRTRDPEYVFDLVSDPGETVNLAGRAGLEAAWLRQRLLGWVASDPDAGRTDARIDDETRARLEALGYLR